MWGSVCVCLRENLCVCVDVSVFLRVFVSVRGRKYLSSYPNYYLSLPLSTFCQSSPNLTILLFSFLSLTLTVLTLQAVFVPMPRHMYGELARSQTGCDIIEQKKLVQHLLFYAKNERVSGDIRRAALWGLGHIR